MLVNYGKNTCSIIKTSVQIEVDDATLNAEIIIPTPPKGIIIVAYVGSTEHKGTSIAHRLFKNNYGAVVVNLLTDEEVSEWINYNSPCTVDLLSNRLIKVVGWIKYNFADSHTNIGLWGSGISAAAALKTSAYLKDEIKVIVSSEGRPELVTDILQEVSSPTLFIVNELYHNLLDINKNAANSFKGKERLVIIRDETNTSMEIENFEEGIPQAIDWIDENINWELCEVV